MPDVSPPPEGRAAARAAGLRYTTDTTPGIARRSGPKGTFRYVDAQGAAIRDDDTLARIRALAVPPAYTDVWICPHPNGHLQATGRDARGRKQYRYHADWHAARGSTKFGRMAAFGAALPALRARMDADLRRPGVPRERVLALVVRLLETTLIRVGNEAYARDNRSYGLTTLRNRHVAFEGASALAFTFRGKSGIAHTVGLRDRRLAGLVRRLRDLPGQHLFQYEDETGAPCAVGSAEVNAYLQEATGDAFTAKDFRTWAASVEAATRLRARALPESEAEAKRVVAEVVEEVAGRLGNTPTVCRKSYVHPAVVEVFLAGQMKGVRAGARKGLSADEAWLLALLRRTGAA